MDIVSVQLIVLTVCLTYVFSAGWQLIFSMVFDKCGKR